jgi:hypothetical protein
MKRRRRTAREGVDNSERERRIHPKTGETLSASPYNRRVGPYHTDRESYYYF